MKMNEKKVEIENLESVTGGYRKARKLAESLGQSPELAK